MKFKMTNPIKILAGGYLVYIGVVLFRDVTKSNPSNKTLMLIAAIVFVIFGAVVCVTSLREMILKHKEEANEVETVSEEAEIVEQIEEIIVEADEEQKDDNKE